MSSNWIETFQRLDPVAQELYKRYSTYRDKNMWKEVQTGQSGDAADIDTKQWKAGSGSNAFYLSPAKYNQYDEWYKQEQTWKKEQQETTKEQQTVEVKQEMPATTTMPVAPMPDRAAPTNFQYTPTTPVIYPTNPTSDALHTPKSATPTSVYTPSLSVYTPKSATPPSVYTPKSAVPSNVTYAPLMSVSGADITSQVNSLLAQLAGLLSSNQQNITN